MNKKTYKSLEKLSLNPIDFLAHSIPSDNMNQLLFGLCVNSLAECIHKIKISSNSKERSKLQERATNNLLGIMELFLKISGEYSINIGSERIKLLSSMGSGIFLLMQEEFSEDDFKKLQEKLEELKSIANGQIALVDLNNSVRDPKFIGKMITKFLNMIHLLESRFKFGFSNDLARWVINQVFYNMKLITQPKKEKLVNSDDKDRKESKTEKDLSNKGTWVELGIFGNPSPNKKEEKPEQKESKEQKDTNQEKEEKQNHFKQQI